MINEYNYFATTNNPAMAEKDYMECTMLDKLFQDAFFAENFVFAGGGSLTKSYALSPRVTQDLDLAYVSFYDLPDNPSRNQLKKFRKRFKDYIFESIAPKICDLICPDGRYHVVTDREQCLLQNQEQWLSSPTIHIIYRSDFAAYPEDIRIEIIPRKYSSRSISFRSVMPYAIPNKKFGQIPTVAYEQTFWDKVFALHSNALSSRPHTDSFYSRHYFDVATLANNVNIPETTHMFSDIVSYQARYTTKGLGTNIAPHDVVLIPSDSVLYALESDYNKMAQRTFNGQKTSWNLIIHRLEQLAQDLKRIPNQR